MLVSDSALITSPLQEAEAIFGDVDDLLAMYEDRKHARAAAAGEEEGLDEDEEDEGLDEEEAEARRLARVRLEGACGAGWPERVGPAGWSGWTQLTGWLGALPWRPA